MLMLWKETYLSMFPTQHTFRDGYLCARAAENRVASQCMKLKASILLIRHWRPEISSENHWFEVYVEKLKMLISNVLWWWQKWQVHWHSLASSSSSFFFFCVPCPLDGATHIQGGFPRHLLHSNSPWKCPPSHPEVHVTIPRPLLIPSIWQPRPTITHCLVAIAVCLGLPSLQELPGAHSFALQLFLSHPRVLRIISFISRVMSSIPSNHMVAHNHLYWDPMHCMHADM